MLPKQTQNNERITIYLTDNYKQQKLGLNKNPIQIAGYYK